MSNAHSAIAFSLFMLLNDAIFPLCFFRARFISSNFNLLTEVLYFFDSVHVSVLCMLTCYYTKEGRVAYKDVFICGLFDVKFKCIWPNDRYI